MAWFLAGILTLLILWAIIHWLGHASKKSFKRMILLAALIIGTLVIIGLFLLGRMPSHLAGLGVGAIWLPKLWAYFARARMAWRMGKFFHQRYQQNQGQAGAGNASMNKAEALSELGLDQGATKQEIMRAYQRLMKTAHPDQGGSTEQAARLNMARDILLE